jgi:predicted aconitase with swiveling domain
LTKTQQTLILHARPIVEGKTTSGTVLYSSKPIAFLQGVDPEQGMVTDSDHEIYSRPFTSTILIFPHGVGSSVGAYIIYRLKKAGKAPNAIINRMSDITTASGCAIAGIPLVDLNENSANFEILKRAKKATVDTKKSQVRVVIE